MDSPTNILASLNAAPNPVAVIDAVLVMTISIGFYLFSNTNSLK
jgi:hypothetical protein